MSINITPENKENYDQMVKILRSSKDHADLKLATMMFSKDGKYSKQDITLAKRVVEKEKGWRM